MSCFSFFLSVVLYLNCLLFYFWVFCMCCWIDVVLDPHSDVTYYFVFVLSPCCIISELSYLFYFLGFCMCCVVSAFRCHVLFCFRVVTVLYYVLIVFFFYVWVFCKCCWLGVVLYPHSDVTYYFVFVLFQCCIISELSFVLFLSVLYMLSCIRNLVSHFVLFLCWLRVVLYLNYICLFLSVCMCYWLGVVLNLSAFWSHGSCCLNDVLYLNVVCFIVIAESIYPIELEI